VLSDNLASFDIANLEDDDLNYSLELRVGQVSKVSISWDIYKMDEMKAGQFLQLVKMYLDDPDYLML